MMRNVLSIPCAALLVLALASPGSAGIDEGDWEVGLGGTFFFSDFHDDYGLGISLGYFVTAEVEIGGFITWNNQNLDGTVVDGNREIQDFEFQKTWWDIAFFVYYHFQVEGEWAPYIGAFVGYESGRLDASGDDQFDRDGFILGGVLGMKYFVSEKTTIFFEYRLGWRSADEWELDDDSDITIEDDSLTHSLLFGISVLF